MSVPSVLEKARLARASKGHTNDQVTFFFIEESQHDIGQLRLSLYTAEKVNEVAIPDNIEAPLQSPEQLGMKDVYSEVVATPESVLVSEHIKSKVPKSALGLYDSHSIGINTIAGL